jgi:hypothetical protein
VGDVNARVVQKVNGWAGWPRDVVERLIQWNRSYLLSFDHHGDFRCVSCGREIAGHQYGNARIRPSRKVKSVVVCEECLIRLARHHYRPPELHPHRVALLQERERYARLERWVESLERHEERLREQITLDHRYIGELQKRMSAEQIASARAAMREVR